MHETPIAQFIQFVELDQKCDALAHEQEELKKRSLLLKDQIQAIKSESQQAAAKVHDLRKQVDGFELELKVVDEAQKDKKFKLAQARSPKEFFSLEHEIQELEAQRLRLDDQGLTFLTSLEDAQKALDLLLAQEPERLRELQNQLDTLTQRLTHVQELESAYREQRKKDEAFVSEELLAKYKQMKERVTNPVVPIIKGSCSACFYAVKRSDLTAAQQGGLPTCADCYRLLYTSQQSEHHD